MAKVSFTKLGLKLNQEIKTINYNDQIIEVKQYLPMEEKLKLVSNVVNYSLDDNTFYNPMKVKIFLLLEIIYAYTNLNFTEKQKEDIFKLYNIFTSNDLMQEIYNLIPEKEINDIKENTFETISNIYKYHNSALGIMEAIASNYTDLEVDATNIQQAIKDPNNLTLLKDIITKLG